MMAINADHIAVARSASAASDAVSPLRILAVAENWWGSNSYAFVRALRTAGHSVTLLPEQWFIPTDWRHIALKALRRGMTPFAVKMLSDALIKEAQAFQPHVLFVFKGVYVERRAIEAIRRLGAVAINFYPDVSTTAHGPYIPEALPAYDWVFTTKSFGITDMKRQLGVTRSSFMPHGYDAEIHTPVELSPEDHQRYDCDASFIGTWSLKKQAILLAVQERLPGIRLKIWGAQWERADPALQRSIMRQSVNGVEYVKAIRASAVNLAILSEVRLGASKGDQITSRTFHIPASGGFMLHERTDEVAAYFDEGTECAMFDDTGELVAKIGYYLAHSDEREQCARRGRQRSRDSGYSIDCRAAAIVARARDLLRARETS